MANIGKGSSSSKRKNLCPLEQRCCVFWHVGCLADTAKLLQERCENLIVIIGVEQNDLN